MELAWVPSMSTGVAELDDHHKQIIAKLNGLLEAISTGRGQDEILRLFDFLSEYVAQHFRAEENCMEKYRCRAAATNKRQHESFVQRFVSLRQRLHDTGPSGDLATDVKKMLLEWLVFHISGTDAQLRSCVRQVVRQEQHAPGA